MNYLTQNNINNEIKSPNDIIKYFVHYLIYSYYAIFYYFINLNGEDNDKIKYGSILEHVGNIKYGYIIYSDLQYEMFPYLLNEEKLKLLDEELSKINKKRYNDFAFDGIDIINKNIYQVKNYQNATLSDKNLITFFKYYYYFNDYKPFLIVCEKNTYTPPNYITLNIINNKEIFCYIMLSIIKNYDKFNINEFNKEIFINKLKYCFIYDKNDEKYYDLIIDNINYEDRLLLLILDYIKLNNIEIGKFNINDFTSNNIIIDIVNKNKFSFNDIDNINEEFNENILYNYYNQIKNDYNKLNNNSLILIYDFKLFFNYYYNFIFPININGITKNFIICKNNNQKTFKLYNNQFNFNNININISDYILINFNYNIIYDNTNNKLFYKQINNNKISFYFNIYNLDENNIQMNKNNNNFDVINYIKNNLLNINEYY